jgi:hypothetical protein
MIFFKQIHFNDSEYNTLMRGTGMLSKQEKQDLASSEALLQHPVVGFSKFGNYLVI